jgi:hypothetical protein
MDSCAGLAEARGCPIRIFTDQSLFAAPHDFSQRTTSFIASQCQGIHQMLLSRLMLSLSMPIHKPASADQSTDKHLFEKTTCARSARHGNRVFTQSPRSASRGHTSKSLHSQCQSALAHVSPVKPGQQQNQRKPHTTKPLSPNQHPARPTPAMTPIGGARRDRTDDLKLAKLALSQLSYGPSPIHPPHILNQAPDEPNHDWWAWEDLNFRPHAYQARALTN